MRRLSRQLLLAAGLALLLAAGATAAAVAVHTITLKPGRCKTVSKTLRVCAAAAAARTVSTTITVAPSPIGKTFSGDGDTTLAPFTLTKGDNLNWTAALPDVPGGGSDYFEIDDQNGNDLCDNGDGTVGSGTCFLAAGTYTLSVTAAAGWTISL